MKHRVGPRHSSRTGHTLFGLFRPDCVRDDDNREFLEMLSRSQRTIFQVCLHFTDRRADSIRDLYQEIAATLWEAWPRFRGESSTDTWVHRVALNVAVTEVRRRARQPNFVPLEEWMYDTIAEEIDKAPPDYFHLISALDPDERALLFLRLEGLPLSDIATILSTTQPAIKQRLYRLRKKIDTRRLSAILDRPEASPTVLDSSGARTNHSRLLYSWGILALLLTAVSVYWGIALWHYRNDIHFRLFTLFVEAAFLFLSAESVATVLALRHHAPTRIGLGGLWSGWRRTVAISLAASCTLVMVSCTPTVGDGYTMTQDHWARAQAIETVTQTIYNP